jgi:hypothetical protein
MVYTRSLNWILIEAEPNRKEEIKKIINPLFNYEFPNSKKVFMSLERHENNIKISENKRDNTIEINCFNLYYDPITFNLPKEAKNIDYCASVHSSISFEFNSQRYDIIYRGYEIK